MSSLKIRVDSVPDSGLDLIIDERDPAFAAALADACDGRPGATGRARLTARYWPGRLDVTGTLEAELPLICSRGLEGYRQPVTTEFERAYVRGLIEPTQEEVELTAEDLDRVPLVGDEVDLGVAVREELILAVPLKPLCVTPCSGPCPSWGVALDLERKPIEAIDPRWAGLTAWKKDGPVD